MNKSISIIGLGNMGSAIYYCLSQVMDKDSIITCDKNKKKADKLKVSKFFLNADLAIEKSDTIILAVKPQSFESLLSQIKSDLSSKLIISIMAGIEVKTLEKKTGTKRIIRAMPNLPIAVKSGFTVWVTSANILNEDIKIVKEIFGSMGNQIQLKDEKMMDAATALSGSGPAYLFYFCELLEEKAIKYGFSQQDSEKIAKATFIGAAELLKKNDKTAKEWRQAVTSPGGTTEAALNYFDEEQLDKIFFTAIDKAKNRGKELNNKSESNVLDNLKLVKQASHKLSEIDDKKINEVILDLADAIDQEKKSILHENGKDLSLMDKNDPKYLRLLLDDKKINSIVSGLKKVAELSSPLNIKQEERTLYNGLELEKRSVPLGVVAVIYESRPNVTPDVFSLCLKSGNACILKGGQDALNSNKILISIIQGVLEKNKINKNVVTLLPAVRESIDVLFKAHGLVDVIIPRGSQGLIDYVKENSQIPVIETGAGVVHIFFDKSADLSMGEKLINNAKTSRPAVCNALDTLVIHKDRLKDLSKLINSLVDHHVEIFADDESFSYLENNYPKVLLSKSSEEDYGREFLSLKMSIKTVNNLVDALAHIEKYSSGHSEAIISEDKDNIEKFFRNVDSAVVYSNAPTVFTDGGEFGLGCEIVISTQKLHARGPMGLKELTSYKWIVRGNGQVRE